MATIRNHRKIYPCFWFNKNAEEAVDFYISVFKNAKKGKVSYYGPGEPMPAGTVLTIPFRIEGVHFLALNGGPVFKFNESISFVVNCNTQKEIDFYWEKLSKRGSKGQCGWLKDKFGVSWQIVPRRFDAMLAGTRTEKASRMMQALLKMKKLNIKVLENAYRGKTPGNKK